MILARIHTSVHRVLAWDKLLEEVGKQRLREFLESTDTGRQAMAMSASGSSRDDDIKMDTLNRRGKKEENEDLDDI